MCGNDVALIIQLTVIYNTVILTIFTSSSGFSLNVRTFSILCTTSSPCVALPKIVWRLSSQGVFSVVMKNCDPFVSVDY